MSQPSKASPRLPTPVGVVVLVAICATAIACQWQQERILDVWSNNAFDDTDDAMRMVQVRDLLAGQGWFDMTAHRLNPPNGSFMHWSRIVDIPLAAGVTLFSQFVSADLAERAVRIAFPAALFFLLMVAGAFAGEVFAGPRYRIFGLLAVFCSGEMFFQFREGRIDHHAPQIILLLGAATAMAKAIDPSHARLGALAGAMLALSLGIGLENVMFLAVIAAAPGLLFVAQGAAASPLLRAFALGVAAALAPIYLATVAPSRWLLAACDALSITHLLAAGCGALAYGVLAAAAPRMKSAATRFGALLLAGLAALAPVLVISPVCMVDPFAGLDPLLRDVWLSHVREWQPLSAVYQRSPNVAIIVGAPVIGFLAAGVGVVRSSGVARARWGLLFAILGVGLVAGSAHVRVMTAIFPLAAVGVLAPVYILRETIAARSPVLATACSFFIVIGFSTFGASLVAAQVPSNADLPKENPACAAAKSFASLAELPPGRIISDISLGPFILMHTSHSVFAAPYHRNNEGNRLALDVLPAKENEVEVLARRAGARYIVFCRGGEAHLVDSAPSGLWARLLNREMVPWLTRLPMGDTPIEAFEVAPPALAR